MYVISETIAPNKTFFLPESIAIFLFHYENKPIQIYGKFYHQRMKIFR